MAPPHVSLKATTHNPTTLYCRLLRDYLECAPGSALEDTIDSLSQSGSSVLKLVHTHEGAAAACCMLAYGSARDRKRMVKAMKGECWRGGLWGRTSLRGLWGRTSLGGLWV